MNKDLEGFHQDTHIVYDKEINIKELGGVLTTVTTIVSLLLNFLWYIYQRGKFLAMNIDSCYLEVGVKSLYEVISFIGIAILLITSNYFVYWSICYKKATRYILITEWIFLQLWVCLISGCSIQYILFDMFSNCLFIEYIMQFLIVFLFIILINAYGIVFGVQTIGIHILK